MVKDWGEEQRWAGDKSVGKKGDICNIFNSKDLTQKKQNTQEIKQLFDGT